MAEEQKEIQESVSVGVVDGMIQLRLVSKQGGLSANLTEANALFIADRIRSLVETELKQDGKAE